jgi:hypothetical protein
MLHFTQQVLCFWSSSLSSSSSNGHDFARAPHNGKGLCQLEESFNESCIYTNNNNNYYTGASNEQQTRDIYTVVAAEH